MLGTGTLGTRCHGRRGRRNGNRRAVFQRASWPSAHLISADAKRLGVVRTLARAQFGWVAHVPRNQATMSVLVPPLIHLALGVVAGFVGYRSGTPVAHASFDDVRGRSTSCSHVQQVATTTASRGARNRWCTRSRRLAVESRTQPSRSSRECASRSRRTPTHGS